ncbi:hypothetical protein ACLMJK_005193 [Lecanora helva]
MHSNLITALGFGLLALNVAALPATEGLEARDTSMTSTINSYIAQIIQAGFVPNAQPSAHKRDGENSPDLAALMERASTKASTPPINMVLSLLQQHGFQPAKTAGHKRDAEASDDLSSPLAKRDLPDINLLISLLKQHGFVPTGKTTARSLEARDSSPSDVNTVINELIAAGYNPNDFGPHAQQFMQEMALPTETTASCPKDNNTLYVAGGQTYEVNCEWDYVGNDQTATRAASLGDCLKACSSYTDFKGRPCVAASFQANLLTNILGNCFMKYNVTKNNHDSHKAAGRQVQIFY